MEFGEMKRNTSNWSNFCMLLRRAGFTASAGLSCINFRWGELFCYSLCLINPLEGLLVRSYYSVCTSCVSFVNVFRQSVQFCSALRNVFVRSYCLTLWLPPNHVEPPRASFASCICHFRHKSSSKQVT